MTEPADEQPTEFIHFPEQPTHPIEPVAIQDQEPQQETDFTVAVVDSGEHIPG